MLIGLCREAATGAPSVLLTLRAPNMRTHRSEVAFPGGKEDDADGNNPVATALRELYEEVGIEPARVRVLGLSHDSMIPNKLRVTPVVAWLGKIDPSALIIAPDEVESAWLAPLSLLLDPKNLERRKVKGAGGMKLPVFTGLKHEIWGLSAFLLESLLQELDKDALASMEP